MNAPSRTEVFEFAGFRLDPRQRLLFGAEDQIVPLTSRAFDTLLYLAEHPNVLIEKQALMTAVWPNVVVEENNLNQNISIVRRALGESPGENRFVVTVPGRGFRFVPLVTRRETPAAATFSEPSVSMPPNAASPAASTLESAAPPASSATEPAASQLAPVPPTRRRWVSAAAVILVVGGLTGYLAISHDWLIRAVAPRVVHTSATSAADTPSIAVLPFANISADKDQEYFADGLTEELSTQLSQLQGLRVVGRASAFAFKGKNEDLRKISAALGVNHILEGTVRKAGNELRITAELVDADGGSRRWSHVYERKLDDVFSIQEEIAKSVAAELSSKLGAHASGLPMTRNAAAYDAYLAGQAHLKETIGSPQYVRGIQELEHAVELDPNFGAAWAQLAAAYGAASALIGMPTADYGSKAQAALSRALQLAPKSPELLVAVAGVSLYGSKDWLSVERLLRGAGVSDETRLSDYWTNYSLGLLLLQVGRTGEALDSLSRARRAEPLLLTLSILLVEGHLNEGDWIAAEREFEHGKTLGRDPQGYADAALLELGMARHDPNQIRAYFAAHPSARDQPLVAALDNPAVALVQLRRAMDITARPANPVRRVLDAQWAAYFGDKELALQALHSAFGSAASGNEFLLWRPVFKDVRRTQGFKDLMRDLRLPEYWRASGNWGEYCHPVGGDDFECS